MKILNKLSVVILVVALTLGLTNLIIAATTVNLGTANSFAVLGGSTVTNTGSSVITGDLGVSPGTAVVGFPPGLVTGTQHAADATALQAQSDLVTAYNDAAGQVCTQDLTGQNLGGLTLTPGVYCFSSSAQLTGTLTLNGQNDPNAVFIFKIGSTLTTASNSVVSLISDAQACNVFWQVVSSATIGTTTSFEGNILALTSITLNTGANVTGRVLARNGAVTLDTNNITKATCAPTPTPTTNPASSPTATPTTNPASSPTATATPTTSPTSSSSSSSSSPSSVYPTLNYVTPIIIESRRVNANSIFISWGPYSGTDTFNVRYGLTNGSWLYNTNVTGFSTTINALPFNQPIWIQVAARDSHTIGIYGESKFVGGPRLPNTGFAPYENNIPFTLNYYLANGLYENQVEQIQIRSTTQHPEAKKQILAIEGQKDGPGVPVRLKIPRINVNAAIEYVGLTSKGEMGVPSNIVDVGWFDLGVRPGERGSAVIAGHFNGENGEDGVFTNLYKLKSGDKLYIEDDNGTSTVFEVRESSTYDSGYADDVFSRNDGAHLNLITCEGAWDTVMKNYSQRLVVFADITK